MSHIKITNHKTACKHLKRSTDLTATLKRYPKNKQAGIKATLELLDIAEAINDITGFKVDWKNSEQRKYYPIIKDGSGFFYSLYDTRGTCSTVSSRPFFISKEVSDYFGKKFIKTIQKALKHS